MLLMHINLQGYDGRYDPMNSDMEVLDAVAVIKVSPKEMPGKYKIGQNMNMSERIELAKNILKKNSKTAIETLSIMGFAVEDGKPVLKTDEEW